MAAFSPDGRFLWWAAGPSRVWWICRATACHRLPPDGPDRRHGLGRILFPRWSSPRGQWLRVGPGAHLRGPDLAHSRQAESREFPVFSVAFSTNGEWLVTAAQEGLQVWRAAQYTAPAARVSAPDLVWSIAFQPDRGGFVTAAQTVQAWRMVPGAPLHRYRGGTRRADRGAYCPAAALAWPGCVAAATPDAVHLLCGDSLVEVLRIPVSSVAAATTWTAASSSTSRTTAGSRHGHSKRASRVSA